MTNGQGLAGENQLPEALPQTKEELAQNLRESTRSVTLEEISEILNSTISHDVLNKKITFLGTLLTYTEEDQVNISFTAESSSGKSYIPLELTWYFPKEDVIEYSYVSPTAFFHEYGALVPDPTDKRDVEDEQRRKIIVIDLHKKILVFVDQPHDMLLQRLRPLLSHDRKSLISKITDHREKAGLRTKSVLIQGFPTVMFCTVKFSMEDQERTRLLLLSPDTTEGKLRDAILLKIEKDSDRQAFQKYIESDPKRNWLRQRVELISSSGVNYVMIPEELRNTIADRFFQKHRNLIPRHQRDITRLLALIKAHALLNLWNRERIQDRIIATEEDVLEGQLLYEKVSTANELGLPPEVHNFHTELIADQDSGQTKQQLQAAYFQAYHRTIGKKRLDEVLGLLASVGLITEDPDPTDKRRVLILPTGAEASNCDKDSEESANEGKINTPQGVGETVPYDTSVSTRRENLLKDNIIRVANLATLHAASNCLENLKSIVNLVKEKDAINCIPRATALDLPPPTHTDLKVAEARA